jgi:hypothetical protein
MTNEEKAAAKKEAAMPGFEDFVSGRMLWIPKEKLTEIRQKCNATSTWVTSRLVDTGQEWRWHEDMTNLLDAYEALVARATDTSALLGI